MKREARIPMRCRRCGGNGEVPIISDEAWIHPDSRPLLECCPDCCGTGLLRESRSDEVLEDGAQ